MWAMGLAILIVGFVIAYFVMVYGFEGIKDAKNIAFETGAPVIGTRILGAFIMCIGVAIIVLVFTILNTLLELTEEDWNRIVYILFGIVVVFGLYVGFNMVRGYTIKEMFGRDDNSSESKISESTRIKLGIATMIGAIIMAVVFIIIAVRDPFSKPNSSSTVTCGVCDRSFKKGSDNASSIARSNMCENCHDNFEWRQEMQDVIDNQPVD